MSTMTKTTTTLYYHEGSSDKVYQVSLEPQNGGYVVNFAFGRRGATLQTGTKTASSVSLEEAEAIYARLIREKQSKGYTEGEVGTPYEHSVKQAQVSGLQPQLLNPIEETEVNRLVTDPRWCMQEKKDGKRVLLRKAGETVEAINRKGLIIGLASAIMKNAGEIPGDFILDGECVGDVLYVFDLLSLNAVEYRPQPCRARYQALAQLLDPVNQYHLELLPACFSPAEKLSELQRFRDEKVEGVVFKRNDAPYTPGRPNRGGTQLKHKFYATGSFIVAGANPQRSVSLRLFEKAATCGNVTIPPNAPIPENGKVVEVRYLYAFKESGCLFQPVYLGERDDLDPSACTMAQIKFKAPAEDEDEETIQPE